MIFFLTTVVFLLCLPVILMGVVLAGVTIYYGVACIMWMIYEILKIVTGKED